MKLSQYGNFILWPLARVIIYSAFRFFHSPSRSDPSPTSVIAVSSLAESPSWAYSSVALVFLQTQLCLFTQSCTSNTIKYLISLHTIAACVLVSFRVSLKSTQRRSISMIFGFNSIWSHFLWAPCTQGVSQFRWTNTCGVIG